MSNRATGARRSVDRLAARAAPPDERGSSAVEAVIVLPALMLLVVAGMQFALYGLAAHAVEYSVAEAGATARSLGGGPTAGRSVLQSDLDTLAGGLVDSPALSVGEGAGNQLTIEASADVPSLIPGVHLHVSAASVGPAQQFRADG